MVLHQSFQGVVNIYRRNRMMGQCRRIIAAVLFVSVSLVLPAAAFALSSVVVPRAFTNVDAPGDNIYPFNCGNLSIPSARYQQVYLGGQIDSAVINTMSFRLGNTLVNNPGFPPTILTDVMITMSTTQAAPDTLSSTFADNVGPDETVIWSGDLTISAPDCSQAVCPFVVNIPFQNTFEFDPALGNLLVDIRLPACVNLGNFVTFDSTLEPDGVIGRVFSLDVASPTGSADGVGLVTRFGGMGFERVIASMPVPTLSEWGIVGAVAGLMLAGVFFVMRRKKKSCCGQ
jgi:hypothetical protein